MTNEPKTKRPDDCAACGHEKQTHTEEDGGEEQCPYCPCAKYEPPRRGSGRVWCPEGPGCSACAAADQKEAATSAPNAADLRRLAIRLAEMAFFDGAQCTCADGDECPLCETRRVLGANFREEWCADGR